MIQHKNPYIPRTTQRRVATFGRSERNDRYRVMDVDGWAHPCLSAERAKEPYTSKMLKNSR